MLRSAVKQFAITALILIALQCQCHVGRRHQIDHRPQSRQQQRHQPAIVDKSTQELTTDNVNNNDQVESQTQDNPDFDTEQINDEEQPKKVDDELIIVSQRHEDDDTQKTTTETDTTTAGAPSLNPPLPSIEDVNAEQIKAQQANAKLDKMLTSSGQGDVMLQNSMSVEQLSHEFISAIFGIVSFVPEALLLTDIKLMVKGFLLYARDHKRMFMDRDEKRKRYKIFKGNVFSLVNHNRRNSTPYRMGINQFSDKTLEEVVKQNTGYKEMVGSDDEEEFEADLKGMIKWANETMFSGESDKEEEEDDDDSTLVASKRPQHFDMDLDDFNKTIQNMPDESADELLSAPDPNGKSTKKKTRKKRQINPTSSINDKFGLGLSINFDDEGRIIKPPGYKGDEGDDMLGSSTKSQMLKQKYKPEKPRNVKQPKRWDWREYGILTPIRNQGDCGACWTFAAVACLEAYNHKRQMVKGKFDKRRLIHLSEQNMLDCAGKDEFGALGCEGGMPQQGWKYVIATRGIAKRKYYPYKYWSQKDCFYKQEIRDKRAIISGVKKLPKMREDYLEQAVYNYGPVAVAIQMTNKLIYYKSGIFEDSECQAIVNHAVVVVGYGQEKGHKYWIIRNSWDNNWGEKGYFRLSRKQPNHCGVLKQLYYPVVPGVKDTVDMLPILRKYKRKKKKSRNKKKSHKDKHVSMGAEVPLRQSRRAPMQGADVPEDHYQQSAGAPMVGADVSVPKTAIAGGAAQPSREKPKPKHRRPKLKPKLEMKTSAPSGDLWSSLMS